MATEDRLTALLALAPKTLTGIDFVRVIEAHDQRRLHVYFHVDPEELTTPFTTTPIFPTEVSLLPAAGVDAAPPVEVVATRITVGEDARTVLEVEVAEPGDFSRYRLYLDDSRVDYYFNGVDLSFKQGCPSDLDCAPAPPDCGCEEQVEVPLDYLARDFTSFRGALLELASRRHPAWEERVEADQGVMLLELSAAVGDELAYVQDRYARESRLETASQRRSVRRMARLVDYALDDGKAATTWLDLAVTGSGVVHAGSQVWSPPVDGGPSIPFEVGEGLADLVANAGAPREFEIDGSWDVALHVADAAKPCLPVGSTELFVVGTMPALDWVGRTVLLRGDPVDPSEPRRRHLLTVTEVDNLSDPLCGAPPPLAITRVRFDEVDGLPFELDVATATMSANVVPAVAGATDSESFYIGDTAGSGSRAVERQGPLNENTGERSPVFLHTLSRTEAEGLGHLSTDDEPVPDIELLEDIGGGNTRAWAYRPTLLDSHGFDDHFTLDDGTWRRIIGFWRGGVEVEHVDYASDAGRTVRFGDGEHGRLPPAGTQFTVSYRTGPGARANLAPGTIAGVVDPVSGSPTITTVPTGLITAATNPFAVVDGADPEDVERAKRMAPEQYRAILHRAVLEEDYREQSERLDWVQQAGASTRWTGSWLSTFVAPDPLGAFELSRPRRAELEARLDCVRQADREVFVRDPRFVDLDLEIAICLEPSAFGGQVKERVREALLGSKTMCPKKGYFHPDRFTFGTPLRRADLEAAVQAVDGVAGVGKICVRQRGTSGWRTLSEMKLAVKRDQLLRLEGDPRHPERGSLRVVTDEAALSPNAVCVQPTAATPVVPYAVEARLVSYVDDGEFARASEASWEIQPGVVQWWQAGELRMLPQGVALEGAGTNLLLHSANIDDSAAWAGVDVAVSANASAAPDRARGAERVRFDAGLDARVQQSASVNNGVELTGSVYHRGNASEPWRLVIQDVELNETTGNETATATWVRAAVTDTTTGAAGGAVVSFKNDLDQVERRVRYWGAQLEEFAFPTSYIRTTSSAGARAFDDLQIPQAKVPAHMREARWRFHLWPEMSRDGHLSATIGQRLFCFDGGNSLSGLLLTVDSGQSVIELRNSATTLVVRSPALLWNAGDRLTITVDPSAGELTLEGFDAGDGTYFGAPFAWTDTGNLYVGNSNTTASPFFGVIGEPYEVPPREFDPLVDVTGLTALLEGDGFTLDGSSITGVTDASGQGNDFAQATGTQQPTLLSNAIGGRDAASFDGVDDVLVGPSLGTLVTASESCAWILLRPRAATATDASARNNHTALGDATGHWSVTLREPSSATAGQLAGIQGSTFDGIEDATSLSYGALSEWSLVELRHEGGTLYAMVDGVEKSVAAGALQSTAGLVSLGDGFGSAAAVDVAFVATSSSAESAERRSAMRDYILERFGLEKFDPAEHVATMAHAWDAAAGVSAAAPLVDGSNVTGHHDARRMLELTQPTFGNQPDYVQSQATLNGEPAISYVRANSDRLLASAVPAGVAEPTAQGFAVYFCGAVTAVDTNPYLATKSSTWSLWSNIGGVGPRFSVRTSVDDGWQDASWLASIVGAGATILRGRYDDASDVVGCRVGMAAEVTAAAASHRSAAEFVAIGADDVGGRRTDMNLGVLYLLEANPSEQDDRRIMAYLANRFGIVL